MDILRLVFLGIAQAFMLFGLCLADDDVVPDSATLVKFDFAQWCKAGNHKFVLESATLADVVRALGFGHIVDTSDPGNADPLWAVDYLNGETVVQFEADGDMGGDEHRLTGVTVYQRSEYPKANRLPAMDSCITFVFGTVGIKFSDLERELGRTPLSKKTASYKYEGKTKVPGRKDVAGMAQMFDVSANLTVKVEAGRVVGLSVSHITTY